MTRQIGNSPAYLSSAFYHEDVEAVDVSGATGIDLSRASVHHVTLTDNVTFSFENPSTNPPGNSLTLIIEQDGTGGHDISWPGAVEWGGGSAPGLSTGAGDKHMMTFVSPDGGTTWIGLPSAQEVA